MTIRISNLYQGYGDNEVLSDISLEIEKGKFVSILGPNGSGKTTLIRTVCNIIKPRNGTIEIDGQNIDVMTPKDFSRKIGYVPQKYVPSDHMKVFDAILIGRAPYVSWSYSDEDFEYADKAIEKIGIEDLTDCFVNNLSGGQMQKVILSRAIAQNPEFFALDEPTSALDLKNQMTTLKTIKSIVNEEKKGAIVALHDLNLAMKFSDRVIMLKDGKIKVDGTPEEAINEENILDVYGVKSEIFEGKSGRFVHILE